MFCTNDPFTLSKTDMASWMAEIQGEGNTEFKTEDKSTKKQLHYIPEKITLIQKNSVTVAMH